ncbi:MAG: metalloregulator ArsR/SmtB family transcription factor [Planctomycetota bacterium]
MREFLAITKALADEHRVRILRALEPGELCVCQIVELLALAPSTVSKHLTILKHAGLVAARKHGRWMYYRLPRQHDREVARHALRFVAVGLSGNPLIAKDGARRARITCIDPEELCCLQTKRRQ